MALVGSGIVLAFQFRTTWLPWLADPLVMEDVLTPADIADVIVVFSGAHGERSRYAAELYQQGFAPRILVTGGNVAKSVELFCRQRVTGAELEAHVLVTNGVPPSAVSVLPQGTSTYEEAQAMQSYVESYGLRSMIAVSSPYHMRRVRATLEHMFRGREIRIRYSYEKGSQFVTREWWRKEQDFLHVVNEYLKLLYYRLILF